MTYIRQTAWTLMNLRFLLTFVIGISTGIFLSIAYNLAGYQLTPGFHHNVFYFFSGINYAPLEKKSHGCGKLVYKTVDRTIADALAKKVRVFCWIMTYPKQHHKATHVKATWGKRCNKLVFISTQYDEKLPTIKLKITEDYHHLWGKTKAAFRYVYEHHRRDADWFMKADDHTYVVVENLRYMLADYNSSDPLYFGNRLAPSTRQGYMSGGAGYVLSREALDRFVNKGLSFTNSCRVDDGGSEDVEMGKCLERIGVKAMDSRDSHHRGRFFPLPPDLHLFPGALQNSWYKNFEYYKSHEGLKSCSNVAISFHYINPSAMYELEYLLYHMQVIGVKYDNNRMPKILRDNKNIVKKLRNHKTIVKMGVLLNFTSLLLLFMGAN